MSGNARYRTLKQKLQQNSKACGTERSLENTVQWNKMLAVYISFRTTCMKTNNHNLTLRKAGHMDSIRLHRTAALSRGNISCCPTALGCILFLYRIVRVWETEFCKTTKMEKHSYWIKRKQRRSILNQNCTQTNFRSPCSRLPGLLYTLNFCHGEKQSTVTSTVISWTWNIAKKSNPHFWIQLAQYSYSIILIHMCLLQHLKNND